MRNKIFGGIGIVWGALILLHWLLKPASGNEAYQAGGGMAAVLGLAMLVAGIYYFRKKPAPKQD